MAVAFGLIVAVGLLASVVLPIRKVPERPTSVCLLYTKSFIRVNGGKSIWSRGSVPYISVEYVKPIGYDLDSQPRVGVFTVSGPE